jgi:sec-independent protein translocase protein TatA
MGFGLGPMELLIVGIIALLLFGKRLPEVAKSLGKGIKEFQKGVKGIEDDVNTPSYASRTETSSYRPEPRNEPEEAVTAPKFEPPKANSGDQA